MIFWDTSALVPLFVTEPATPAVSALAERDPACIVWWGTLTECASAIARRERDGALTLTGAEQARAVLAKAASLWSEVLASEEVREHAHRLLLRHPLRAADALQLAAALTWAEGRPRSHVFATFDTRLHTAARGEGFSLPLPLPPV